MNLKHVVVSAALACGASVALADSPFTAALSFVGGTVGFSRTPTNGGTLGVSFVDTYNFTLTGTSFLTFGSITTSEVPATGMDLDFTSVALTGPSGPYNYVFSAAGSAETYRLDPVSLTPGSYSLVMSGLQEGTAPGSYGGQLNIVPIPEPETYTLMLAGVGALGFIFKRRRQR